MLPVRRLTKPAQQEERAECRICLEADWRSALIAPCDCDGSVRYTHKECLRKWAVESGRRECEICHAPFHGVDDVIFDVQQAELSRRRLHAPDADGEDWDEGFPFATSREGDSLGTRFRSALGALILLGIFVVLLSGHQHKQPPSQMPKPGPRRPMGGNWSSASEGAIAPPRAGKEDDAMSGAGGETARHRKRRREMALMSFQRWSHILFMALVFRIVFIRAGAAHGPHGGRHPFDEELILMPRRGHFVGHHGAPFPPYILV